jgi:hypothetical protein
VSVLTLFAAFSLLFLAQTVVPSGLAALLIASWALQCATKGVLPQCSAFTAFAYAELVTKYPHARAARRSLSIARFESPSGRSPASIERHMP